MRDLGQVECLVRQIYGKRNVRNVLDIYKRAVINTLYGYLLFDLAIQIPHELRFRSHIAEEPPCEVVYIYGELT